MAHLAGANQVSSASDPAVVARWSEVSTLSLVSAGTPCRGPRGPFDLYSASSCAAISRARGLVWMTARALGRGDQRRSMRSRYICVSCCELCLPLFIAAAMSSSDSSGDGGAEAGLSGISLRRADTRHGCGYEKIAFFCISSPLFCAGMVLHFQRAAASSQSRSACKFARSRPTVSMATVRSPRR